MWIKGFKRYIFNSKNLLDEYTLEKGHVVIDARSFFYTLYRESNSERFTGGEYGKYADFVKGIITQFQKSRITPYFIFEGGHSGDFDHRIEKFNEEVSAAIKVGKYVRDPILSGDVTKQVLDELGVKYAISILESKRDIVDLAIVLNCPIVSFDFDYCFYPVDYIPYTTLNFEEVKLKCKMYRLEKFLSYHSIDKDAFAIFGAMLDQKTFPYGYFNKRLLCLRNIRKFRNVQTILSMLKLGNKSLRQIVLDNITEEEKRKFTEAEAYILNCLNYEGNRTLLVDYLLYGKHDFDPCDLWFEFGVHTGRIAKPYVDLIKHKIMLGSSAVEDIDREDSSTLSLNIIRYAYDLLTNYNGSTFTFACRVGNKTVDMEVTNVLSIQNPNISTEDLFRNGWTDFTTLFDSFLRSIPVEPADLERLPENARIFMATVTYFSRKTEKDKAFIYSLLLCYVLLNTCSSQIFRSDVNHGSSDESISSNTAFTEADRQFAAAVTKKYFTVNGDGKSEFRSPNPRHYKFRYYKKRLTNNERNFLVKLDRKILHPIVQFEFCLANMNYLNNLCATKYPAAIYHNIINGTFIYNLVQQLKDEECPLSFLRNLLSKAPTVFNYFLELVDFHDKSLLSN